MAKLGKNVVKRIEVINTVKEAAITRVKSKKRWWEKREEGGVFSRKRQHNRQGRGQECFEQPINSFEGK